MLDSPLPFTRARRIGILLAALFCCAAASGACAAPAAVHAPGALVAVGDYALHIDMVRPANDEVHAASRFNPPPAPGKEYVQTFVSIECNAERCRVAPERFTIRDQSGAVFEPRQLDLDGDALIAVQLRRGESLARRTLVFEVNAGAQNLRLVHRAGILFGPETTFAVP